MSSKFKMLKYIEKINYVSQYTTYCWFYQKDNDTLASKHRTYNDSNKFTFLRKTNYYRSTIFNEKSDEIRLDFDNKDINENIKETRIVIEKLFSLGITKFETYLTGSKGTHLCLRYSTTEFGNIIECGRGEIRKGIYEALGLNVKVDPLLFRTQQMIGLEGYNNRKTEKPKLRIQIDYNSYRVLKDKLNFEYLDDSFINHFSNDFILKIKTLLITKKSSSKRPKVEINLSKSSHFDSKKLSWEIKRFEEIFLNSEDGKKRIFDSLTRLLISRTKNLDITKSVLYEFKKRYSIECNSIDTRIKSSKSAYEKFGALFPYKDILTKEDFYKGWPY